MPQYAVTLTFADGYTTTVVIDEAASQTSALLCAIRGELTDAEQLPYCDLVGHGEIASATIMPADERRRAS